jgi:adenosylcobyric acid synthase
MLGRDVRDPRGVEGAPGARAGLGLLDVETELSGDKTLREVQGNEVASGAAVSGYEMHMGRTTGPDTARPMLRMPGGDGGAVSADGLVRGCYLHGLFAADRFRHAFLSGLKDRAPSGVAYGEEVDRVLDDLAAHLATHLDLDRIWELARAR